MRLTGNNSLYLPQVSCLSFELQNTIVNSWENYGFFLDSLVTENYTGSYIRNNLFNLSGGYILCGTKKVSTYNTGEPFSLSGIYDHVSGCLLDFDGIKVFRPELKNGKVFGRFFVNCPSTGEIVTTINFSSENITLDFTTSGLNINSVTTGLLTSSVPLVIFNGTTFFYQSYEKLLDPKSNIFAFITSGEPISIRLYDGDSSYQNNLIKGTLDVYPLWGENSLPLEVPRVIPYDLFYNLTGLNNQNCFTGLLNGLWENNRFTFQNDNNLITMSYRFDVYDAYGGSVDKTLNIDYSFLNQSYYSYISGFNLTASGEYTKIPSVNFTGYYYVTGITKDFNSMLFSSGCSGNILVNFSGNGVGASGWLITHPIQFQDLYTPGVNTYYLVDNYQSISEGTGYTLIPAAIIQTGQYGTTCYDVPRKYGYNVAWFSSSFATSGALAAKASYLTGEALYKTGFVSGGLTTGYIITGINIWNIGSGYDYTYFPKCSFVRQSGDNLSGNASGNFLLATGLENPLAFVSVDAQIGNTDYVSGIELSSIQIPSQEYNVNFKINYNGIHCTSPLTGVLTLSYFNGSTMITGIQDQIVFYRSFDTGFNALKKNDNLVSGLNYTFNSTLSFDTSQEDLDTIYANFNNGFEIGDLNF